MRIVFTGGGTGGHFFPILAVARELKRLAEEARILDLELYFLGPGSQFGPESLQTELLRQEGVLASRIASGKLRRYLSFRNVIDTFKVGWGIVGALSKLFFIMPDVIFSKGGYGSVPVLVAARLYRIPVVMHESDTIPGRVNRWAARFATRIAISFPRTAKFFPKERTALTGNPVRQRILAVDPEQARESLGVFSSRPVILVIGGSQGARILNETASALLPQLLERYEVIHQVGSANLEDVRLETAPILEQGGREFYHLYGFLDEVELASAYQLADIVVSRAAASSIFEIAAWGKPSVLIPLKNSAQEHQRDNP